jgi:hypothetical protein
LGDTRIASARVAHWTAAWRSKQRPVEQEGTDAQRLDLLGASCLVLARSALDTGVGNQQRLTAVVRDLSEVLAWLARAPGDRPARRHAADRSLEVARSLSRGDAPADWAAVAAVRLVAAAIVMFAGVAPSQADEAVRRGDLRLQHDHPIRSATEEPR